MVVSYPRIDANNNGWDALAVRLARRGLSAKVIAKETGLMGKDGGAGRARNRYRKEGVKLSDYRNGIGPEARSLLENTRRELRATFRTLSAPPVKRG